MNDNLGSRQNPLAHPRLSVVAEEPSLQSRNMGRHAVQYKSTQYFHEPICTQDVPLTNLEILNDQLKKVPFFKSQYDDLNSKAKELNEYIKDYQNFISDIADNMVQEKVNPWHVICHKGDKGTKSFGLLSGSIYVMAPKSLEELKADEKAIDVFFNNLKKKAKSKIEKGQGVVLNKKRLTKLLKASWLDQDLVG